MSVSKARFDRTTAYLAAGKIGDAINSYVARFAICGSYRRGLPTCGDVDILVIPSGPASGVIGAARSVCIGGKPDTEGPDQIFGTVLVGTEAVPFQIWLTTPEAWGAALWYATGSRKFNVLMRGIAKSRGFKLNQYGVFKRGRARPIPDSSFSERAVARTIGISWLPPEARTGEWGGWTTAYDYAVGVKAGETTPVPAQREKSPASEPLRRLVPMSKKMERFWK